MFPDFTQLQNLEELDLSDNHLREIPNLTLYRNLKRLAIDHNNLSGTPSISRALSYINLADNHLREFPNFTHPRNTASLNLKLDNNHVNWIPDSAEHLQWLSITNNPLIFIPAPILDKFRNQVFVYTFKEQLKYPCQSSLAKLYHAFMAGPLPQEKIKIFDSLDDEDKNLILGIVCENTEKKEPIAFDEQSFGLAVQKAIMTKFNRLSDEQRDRVYEDVCNADSKIPKAASLLSKWAKEEAKSHITRLADAIARVDQKKRHLQNPGTDEVVQNKRRKIQRSAHEDGAK
jgi:hypothetical protein